MAIITGNSKTEYSMNVRGDAKDIKINLGDAAIKEQTDTAAQEVIKSAGKTASKIIQSGGDIISAPAIWLKDMQQNWLTYMIVAAIILSCIVFLYCAICSYLNRKKSNWSNNNLVELAQVISNKNGALQQPLPLTALNLPSVLPNSMV